MTNIRRWREKLFLEKGTLTVKEYIFFSLLIYKLFIIYVLRKKEIKYGRKENEENVSEKK